MALSIDQSIGTTEASTVASATASFGTAPLNGSVIVVPVSVFTSSANESQGIASVSDNQSGNTWNRATNIILGTAVGGTGNEWVELWYSNPIGTPSGTFTLTVTANDSASFLVFGAIAVKGFVGTATLGPTSTNTGNSTSPTATSITTTKPNAVVVGAITINAGETSITKPSNYTQIYDDPTASVQPGDGQYRLRTSTATETPAWTLNSTATDWAVAMMAIQDPTVPPAALDEEGLTWSFSQRW